MMKKADILKSLSHYQLQATVYAWMVRDGGPYNEGYVFVPTPRGHGCGFIVHISDDGLPTLCGEAADQELRRKLFRLASDMPTHIYDSLLEAYRSWTTTL